MRRYFWARASSSTRLPAELSEASHGIKRERNRDGNLTETRMQRGEENPEAIVKEESIGTPLKDLATVAQGRNVPYKQNM